LQDWDYKPGQVVARRFQGKDGEKINCGLIWESSR